MTELFPFQEEGVKFLASRRRALLLDDPGLGKTLQAIRASDMLDTESMDVICPASVRTQWRKAYASDTVNKKTFESYSYEHARSNKTAVKGVVCIDESHMLKNSAAKRTQTILGSRSYGKDGIIFNAGYVWAMTGTPMPKDASDLYAPLYAICPGALAINGKTMNRWQFIKHFCKTRPGFGGSLQVYGSKNLPELKDRMAPFCLRRTKEEVFPQWNKPVVAEVWLEADSALKTLEDSEEGRLMREAFEAGGLEGLMGLSDSVATIRRHMGILTVEPLMGWLLEQFDCGLDKAVVVCYHREVMKAFKANFEKHGIQSSTYWGGLTDQGKAEAKEDFINKGEVKVILLQITAGGTGLDGLQHIASTMVFAEFSWIDDENKQTIGRLDRIGQKNPVLVRFAGIEGSLHGDIMQAVRRRAADNKTLFN